MPNQPNQFEITFAYYGVEHDGVRLNRSTAQAMAHFARNMYITAQGALFTRPTGLGVVGHVVDVRLDDDPSDATKGQVIAVCEPVGRVEPYKPEMEHK